MEFDKTIKNFNRIEIVEKEFLNTPMERIRYVAKQKNKALTEMAKALGVSHAAVLGWLSKRELPPLHHMDGIADFLDVSVRYLVTGHGEHHFEDVSLEEKRLLQEYHALSAARQEEVKAYISLLLKAEKEHQKL